MVYSHVIRGQRFVFAHLAELLAKANERKSGDELAGIAATSEQERVVAKLALADVPLQAFLDQPVKEPILQLVLGDGLSATALATQGPVLMDLLWSRARALNWSLGRPFLIQHCRVGILNEIGRLLNPEVVVLLIGERPGLAQADSLSAYLAYRPQPGQTDAHRNLISNIHSQGVLLEQAAERIMQLAMQMRELGYSGVRVKEGLALPRCFWLSPLN